MVELKVICAASCSSLSTFCSSWVAIGLGGPSLSGVGASTGPDIVLRIEPAPSVLPPFLFLRLAILHLSRKCLSDERPDLSVLRRYRAV